MSLSKNYGGAVWTNHAMERLLQRGLSQDWAWQTFQYPEKTSDGKQVGTMEYKRRFGDYQVTVIAKQNEYSQWIILSCWIDPPFPGSIDIKNKDFAKKYNNAGFWKRIWLLFLRDVLKI